MSFKLVVKLYLIRLKIIYFYEDLSPAIFQRNSDLQNFSVEKYF